eukprot:TRINITY_DN5043_c0_g1_i1.p1 TRINITY_DN5043_c0_g1~~TRINITY_DN5043_c0_g1_i1.p1  ORF type:complete len:621 (-),score=164.77 TRINITY_DN5043_c0_g1_i1:38-1900(-)
MDQGFLRARKDGRGTIISPVNERKLTIQEQYIELHTKSPFRKPLTIAGVLLLTTIVTAILTWYFSGGPEPASVVVINSRVWTGDDSHPWAEAFAIKGNRIFDIGTTRHIKKFIGERTRVLDGSTGNFKLVTPGFFDTHIHLMRGGFALLGPQLREAMNKKEFQSIMKKFVDGIPKGKWVREGNWNHENWGGVLPDHTWLDEVTPNNPVIINRMDGHTVLVNKLAMQIANITAATPDVEGGTILRDKQGNPTGILKDNAMYLVFRHMPPVTSAEEDEAFAAAQEYVLSNGVTTAHHIGIFAEARKDMEAFERAHKAGSLKLRIYFAADYADWKEIKERIDYEGVGDDHLRIGNLKTFVDGSLGSKTALMFEPYTDGSIDSNVRTDVHLTHEFLNQHGLVVTEEDQLLQWVLGSDAAGLQSSIHAIGDRANNILLNIYEKVIAINGPKDRRFRIEHAQHMKDEDMARLKKLGVIVSMQPYHAIDDGVWAEKVLGKERIKNLYPFKSLFDNNATVVFGSDWFVAPPNPMQGIYAAVTRATLDGKNPDGWTPEQKITVEQSMRAYTRDAAYSSFDEHHKGTIKKGYLADFVLLDTDVFEVDPKKLWDAHPVATYVDGRPVWEQK